ncbi:MAG: SCP2 sterol-binding domain-containing protein [Thermoplasmatales archaeon]|nr:SCP2 sterol-binding domain-containing protein [Thermoplasmatales archaeon]
MSLEPVFLEYIEKFRKRMAEDEKAREKVRPVVKTVNFDLGEEAYSFRLEDADIHDFAPRLLEESDITITSKPEHIKALIDGDLRPMRAYLTKKISVKGKLEDLMHLRELF